MKLSVFRVLYFVIKIGVTILLALLCFILFLYSGTRFYHFQESRPFAGENIFNPYESIKAITFKANFHGHSKAWLGLTHGTDTDEDLIDAYWNKGYDLACLSNYHKISHYNGQKQIATVPVYEHGYNINKVHYLAINANKVSFWDFPLWQSSDHQQYLIHKLKEKAEFVAIAHPKFGGGRTINNMKQITGYHFTEVLNHYRTSEEHWDAALSTGKLSWILANDDIHSLKDPEIFQRFNIIFSASLDSLLSDLKVGRNYGIESFSTNISNTFLSCKNVGKNSFAFRFEKPVDTLLFIGQNGAVKHKAIGLDSTVYTFGPQDTYIRVVAKNINQNIYLNPLVRCEDHRPIMASELVVEEVVMQTLFWKSAVISLMIIVVLLWWKFIWLFKPTT